MAVGTDAAQIAGQRAGGDAVRHLPSGDLRRTAGDAINPTRPTGLLGSLPALLQEPQQLATEDQCRPSIVDGRQALLQPAAHRVLMDAEQPRNVLHRIVSVNLYEPGIGVSRTHEVTPDRLPKSTAAAARCALPPTDPIRLAHKPGNVPLCETRARRRSLPAWPAIVASRENRSDERHILLLPNGGENVCLVRNSAIEVRRSLTNPLPNPPLRPSWLHAKAESVPPAGNFSEIDVRDGCRLTHARKLQNIHVASLPVREGATSVTLVSVYFKVRWPNRI